jgi:hypothetical protein
MKKLLISGSALVLGMALSTMALAASESSAVAKDGSKANSSSLQNGTDSSSVTKTSNSSESSSENTSINARSTSAKTDNSGNTTNKSENSSKTTDSHNVVNSSERNTSNSSKADKNTTTNIDNSYNDKSNSYNRNSNTSVSANAALSLQLLRNEVSGVAVKFREGSGGDGGNAFGVRPGGAGANGGNGTSNASSNLSTGAVNSSGDNNFSGIQTANYDTGFGAAVQGGTGLAATSSISFADSHH